MKELSNIKDEKQQKNLMQKSGEIISEILDDDLITNERAKQLLSLILQF